MCLTQRITSHKVFAGLAERGKTSTGWFFGFKLHLVINDRGELLNVKLTPANVDDRQPVSHLERNLFGKLFGDKGYISQPLQALLRQSLGLDLITKLRSNSKKPSADEPADEPVGSIAAAQAGHCRIGN